MTTLHQSRPFNVRYVIWNPVDRHGDDVRATHRTAKCSYLYINRQNGIDDVGPTPNYAAREDLVGVGRVGPLRANHPALDGIKLWESMDALARVNRPTEATLAHAVGSLPISGSPASWHELIQGFCEDHLASQGMVTDYAIHAQDEAPGRPAILPHVHLLIATRVYDPLHADLGRRRQTWLRTPASCKSLAEKWFATVGIYPPTPGAFARAA